LILGASIVVHVWVIDPWFTVPLQEDEDRLREGEGEEGGEEENMINVLNVQPIPAFCSR